MAETDATGSPGNPNDPRSRSVQSAVEFVKTNNILGLVLDASLLVRQISIGFG